MKVYHYFLNMSNYNSLICRPDEIKIKYTEDNKLPANDSGSSKDASFCSLNITEASSSYCSTTVSNSNSASNLLEFESDEDSCQPAFADVNCYLATNVSVDRYSRSRASTDVTEADASCSRSNSVAVAGADTYSKLTTSTDSAVAVIKEASHYETRVSPSSQDQVCHMKVFNQQQLQLKL